MRCSPEIYSPGIDMEPAQFFGGLDWPKAQSINVRCFDVIPLQAEGPLGAERLRALCTPPKIHMAA
jgi:hypothetical protein